MKVPVGISTVIAVVTIIAAAVGAVISGLDGAGTAVPLTLSIIAGVLAAVLSVLRSWQANTLAVWTDGGPDNGVSATSFEEFRAGLDD
jgi:hypothetical protein